MSRLSWPRSPCPNGTLPGDRSMAKKRKPPKREPKRPPRPTAHPDELPASHRRAPGRALDGRSSSAGCSALGGAQRPSARPRERSLGGPSRCRTPRSGPRWPGRPSIFRPTAPTPTSCWPNTPAAARRPCACTSRAWPPASGRWGRRPSSEDAGHFWGILETRPYMRARLGLAHPSGPRAGVTRRSRHLQDMLRLNPGDNQGVRYTLAGFLLFLDRDDDLARLLQQYPTRARRPGPTPRPCSPSAGTGTRPRPASCSRRPGRRTSTSRPTSWARSSRRRSRPAPTAPATRARP